jgi:hypothetical protein
VEFSLAKLTQSKYKPTPYMIHSSKVKKIQNRTVLPADFWRKKFMQVLEVFHDAELHWHKELWENYGITQSEMKVIEKEFARQQAWRAKRDRKMVEVHDDVDTV